MQKIPTLFERDFENKECPATEKVEPGCEWVLEGEGVATVKWDGTSCLVLSSTLYRRHRVKAGKEPPPRWFHWSTSVLAATLAARPAVPPNSGHGWVAIYSAPADVHHREAWRVAEGALEDGTYELIGPSVQKNPYGLKKHVLVPHGGLRIGGDDLIRTYGGIGGFLAALPHEGIVFHHPDGRMAKIKRRDFGLGWPRAAKEFTPGRLTIELVAEQGAVPGFARGTV